MAEMTYTVITGMRCDAKGCGREFPLSEPVSYFEARAALKAIGGPLGWSLWVSRSRRTYCPDHGPKPGSKMRKVW